MVITRGFQSAEKPGCASSGSRVFGVYSGKKPGKPAKKMLLASVEGTLPEELREYPNNYMGYCFFTNTGAHNSVKVEETGSLHHLLNTEPIPSQPSPNPCSRRRINNRHHHRAGYRAYQLHCLERGVPVDGEGFVVCKPNGQPYAPDSLSQKWERFLAENNLPKIRLHDTRHTCTTAMLSAGIDHKTVSQRLGHADVYIPLNTYAHCTPAMDKAAAEKLDHIIFDKASNS